MNDCLHCGQGLEAADGILNTEVCRFCAPQFAKTGRCPACENVRPHTPEDLQRASAAIVA